MRPTSSTLSALACLGLIGCGAPFDTADDATGTTSEPDIDTATSAVSVPCGAGPSGSSCVEFQGSGGLLTIRIKTCPRSAEAAGLQILQCPGEPGFSVIGGGGAVVGTPSPGALMTHSYLPFRGAGFWEARFKTHHGGGGYRAQAYSISLKVRGWSATKLADSLLYVTKTEFGPAPTAIATLPSTTVRIGGGGYVQGSGAGLLLEQSKPSTDGWRVNGAYHLEFDDGLAHAIAIGLPGCSSGICFTATTHATRSATVPTGYATTSVTVPKLLSGVGGVSFALDPTADDIQRFLTHMIPFSTGSSSDPPGAFVRGKDRSVAVPGYVEAHAVSLGGIALF